MLNATRRALARICADVGVGLKSMGSMISARSAGFGISEASESQSEQYGGGGSGFERRGDQPSLGPAGR
jgi:hypothetical protein